MEVNDSVLQNLRDAGCDEETIRAFQGISLREANREKCSREQERLLSQYRKSLLDALHQDQFRLDCLDYLMFHLRKA